MKFKQTVKRFAGKTLFRFKFWTRSKIVAHELGWLTPRVKLAFQPRSEHLASQDISQRLIDAYLLAESHKAESKLNTPEDDLWTNLLESEFQELLKILRGEDAEALAQYLAHFGEEYTWFGGLSFSLDGFTRHRSSRAVALSYLDKLICLAESIGVLPLENPEQPSPYGQNMYRDVDRLVEQVEQSIGIPVVPPLRPVPVTGIKTKSGLLHYRHLNSLYTALRLKAILPNFGAISEYGGGLGLVAYYATQLGFSDYTIFDLPIVNVFSAHFLLHLLGSDAVSLYGEERESASIKLLPYWECVKSPAKSFSLALNQDSFPEVDPKLLREYLCHIERTTTQCFLSINQESQALMSSARRQNFLPELVKSFPSYHQLYRMKYWIREGYVEELYQLLDH